MLSGAHGSIPLGPTGPWPDAPAVARGALDRSGRPPGAPVGGGRISEVPEEPGTQHRASPRPDRIHLSTWAMDHRAITPSIASTTIRSTRRPRCVAHRPEPPPMLRPRTSASTASPLSDQRSAADRGHSRSAVADRRTRRQRAADRRQRRSTILRPTKARARIAGRNGGSPQRRRLRDKCRPAPPSMACSAARGRRWAMSDSRCSLRRWCRCRSRRSRSSGPAMSVASAATSGHGGTPARRQQRDRSRDGRRLQASPPIPPALHGRRSGQGGCLDGPQRDRLQLAVHLGRRLDGIVLPKFGPRGCSEEPIRTEAGLRPYRDDHVTPRLIRVPTGRS